jgi:predicted nucleotidyltransferase
MIDIKLKNLIVSRIEQHCGKCAIYLFGSYAYGNPGPGSDLDIAVVMESDQSTLNKSIELWEAFEDVPIAKDFVVISKNEYDFYKNEPGSLFRTIAEKGVPLREEG